MCKDGSCILCILEFGKEKEEMNKPFNGYYGKLKITSPKMCEHCHSLGCYAVMPPKHIKGNDRLCHTCKEKGEEE